LKNSGKKKGMTVKRVFLKLKKKIMRGKKKD